MIDLRPLGSIPRIKHSGGDGSIEDADKFARRLISFYDLRARWHRRFYRVSGITVILAGSSLPILTSLNYTGKNLLISLLGVVVAGMTALRAFYRWDQSWILLRNTEVSITSKYLNWRSIVLSSDADADLTKATRELIEDLSRARVNECESFFEHISFPSAEAQHIAHVISRPPKN